VVLQRHLGHDRVVSDVRDITHCAHVSDSGNPEAIAIIAAGFGVAVGRWSWTRRHAVIDYTDDGRYDALVDRLHGPSQHNKFL
jgi:hypothetical protein